MELIRGYRFFSEDKCKQVIGYCDRKEKELIRYFGKTGRGKGKGKIKPKDSKIPVTQKSHSLYNFFLENPRYVPHLLTCLGEMLPELEFPIAVQAWVNIYRKGQGIMWHSHAGKNGYSFSANVFLGGSTTPGIYYSVNPEDGYNIENEVGSLHLFPHSLNHMVPPNESDQKRYTLGITVHGFSAIDKALIQGAAVNNSHCETIILSKT